MSTPRNATTTASRKPAAKGKTSNATNTPAQAPTTPRPPLQNIPAGAENAAESAELLEIRRRLFEVEKENEQMKKKLEDKEPTPAPQSDGLPKGTTPRPPGGISTWTNIQEKMKLVGSDRKNLAYARIQAIVQDTVKRSPIERSMPWALIPAHQKVDLYATVANAIPGMERYDGHWATEAIAYQYHKNRRSHAYRNGVLEVPAKYAHLKENSACRTDAPRTNAHKKQRAEANRKALEAKKAAAKKTRIQKTKAGAKGKASAGAANSHRDGSDDDDEVEEEAVAGPSRSGGGGRKPTNDNEEESD